MSVTTLVNELTPIHIVAATKYFDVAFMNELYNDGIRIFGENKVQSLLEKYNNFIDKGDLTWHFIGSLQTNKVKYIIDKVEYIHSLDRIGLAAEIQKQAKKTNKIQKVFIEINIANEENKQGIPVNLIDELIEYVLTFCPNIQICGLMMMAPHIAPEKTTIYFAQTQELLVQINDRYPNLRAYELSMGMSNDYKIAIQYGATYIRLGSLLAEQ